MLHHRWAFISVCMNRHNQSVFKRVYCFLNRLFTSDKEKMVLQAVEEYQASKDKVLSLNGLCYWDEKQTLGMVHKPC